MLCGVKVDSVRGGRCHGPSGHEYQKPRGTVSRGSRGRGERGSLRDAVGVVVVVGEARKRAKNKA